MTNTFSRTLWYSLRDAAEAEGVVLTAVIGESLSHPVNPMPGRRVYDLIDPRNFDGVLLFTGSLGEFSADTELEAFVAGLAPLPVVSLGVALPGVCSVAVDQAAGVAELVRHLHTDHGHRRFGFVEGPVGQIEARTRRTAVVETLAALGLPAAALTFYPGDYSRRAGADGLRALAAAEPSPGVLVCCNDEEAFGALEEAQRLGVPVPGRIAVTGFDDVVLAGLQEPSLTTVGQPMIQLAGLGLGLLLRQMAGEKVSTPELLAPRLLRRESCGCRPRIVLVPAEDKAGLITHVTAQLTNTTGGFATFAREWCSDFLTAFEYLLDTGNAEVLRLQWSRYYARPGLGLERGVSFRRLFAGLRDLYSGREGFEAAYQENLLLAGGGEARRGTQNDQVTRNFFFGLHSVEAAIARVTSWEALADLGDPGWADVGVQGVAVVRFGAPPRLVYHSVPRLPHLSPGGTNDIDYPDLLPPNLSASGSREHRVIEALTAETSYLGYVVFWTGHSDASACDLVATQLAGALQRIELWEQVQAQSRQLSLTLDETRRMQEQLVETEKVASLGRLVAGVAHEINTPLGTGITGTSFLLERLQEVHTQFAGGHLARSGLEAFLAQGADALEGVLRNLMKAGELIQAFKGLGLDHGQGEWRPVAVRALFEDLMLVYRPEFEQRTVALAAELPGPDLHVVLQPSALIQVVGELLENALQHAFPPDFARAPRVVIQVEQTGDELRVAVTDNGRGLSAEERRHLFDPLYTTRRPEGHAGLGLHLAFQLVGRTLGGRISVASEPGSGTCFLCVIPLKSS